MTSDTAPAPRVDDAPPIPGLRFRAFDIDRDLPEIAELIIETGAADRDDYAPSVEDLRNGLIYQAHFEPARDALVAEIDGKIVGAAMRTIRERAGAVQHQVEGWVAPAHRRRGIGRAMLGWNEARSRDVAAGWSGPEPHVFNSWVSEGATGALALLESAGYERVRYGFMMVRPLNEPIPEAPLPEGLEVRPVVEADHRRIWDADVEAFRDHWEAAVRTEEDYLGWFATPDIDTSMWRVAWAGDEIAGSVMAFIFPEENERLGVKRGWLEHISVRRPWRKQGLAGALIAQSLQVLRDRGMEEAALGVDAENVTGALRLYERFGFRRYRTGIAYRKAL